MTSRRKRALALIAERRTLARALLGIMHHVASGGITAVALLILILAFGASASTCATLGTLLSHK